MVNKPPTKEKDAEFHVLVADVDKAGIKVGITRGGTVDVGD